MVLDNNSSRLLIYFFYDKNGVVDDYIPYVLTDMQKNVSDIFVVCNGLLTDEGKIKFQKFTDDILVRENKGFDVWAYKDALEKLGWETLGNYDEIILMNYTIAGPVYPFEDMFHTMNSKDVDFWGITQFYRTEDDPFGTMPDGFIPDHIQSHFIAVRKNMLNSEAFHNYWEEMPMITGYLDSVTRHEARFTKFFEKAGFKWEVYVDAKEYRNLSHQPIIGMATKILEEKKCPVFKRRSFMQNYNVVLNESCGQEAMLLYKYLEEKTDYNVDLIMDNLLRVENLADLKKNFQWNYVLSSKNSEGPNVAEGKKIALVMHIYFEELINECVVYAAAMPDTADLYITTDTENKKRKIEEAFSKLNFNILNVTVVPNKGRDVAPFLVGFRKYLGQYDYVCHVHDKKAGQTKPGTIGTSFAYKCFENVLASKKYVENILSTFERNKRLGMLVPPPPNHGDYYITLGLEWGNNYENTVKLAKELGINVSMSPDKEPIAGLGSYFWVRGKALKPIFDKEWSYDDFPSEPVDDDGTIMHAIERIYPFAVQSMGFYSGWVLSDTGAALEITNLNHMLKELNNIIFFKGQDAGTYHETLMNLSRAYDVVNGVRQGGYIPANRKLGFLPDAIRDPMAKVWHKIKK